MRLENLSNDLITNPHLEINGKGILYSFADLLGEIPLAGLSTLDDTLKAIWSYLNENTYHWNVSSTYPNGAIDPLKTWNIFGSGLCGDNATVCASILYYLGFTDVVVGGLSPFHVITMLKTRGRAIPLDSDLKVVYPNRGGSMLADLTDLMSDQDLVGRQHHYGLFYNELQSDRSMSSIYSARTPYLEFDLKRIDSMTLQLRPQESFTYTYDVHPARYSYYHAYGYAPIGPPPTGSTGFQLYAPKVCGEFLPFLSETTNVMISGPEVKRALVAREATLPASFTLENHNPYAITDAQLVFTYERLDSSSSLAVEFKKDYSPDFTTVFVADSTRLGLSTDTIDFYQYIQPVGTPMTNRYSLRFTWRSESPLGISIDSLRLRTTFQFSPSAIPRLRVGDNSIHLTSSNGQPLRGLLYSHVYRSVDSLQVPPPVTQPIYPQNGSDVSTSQFEFRWQPPSGISMSDILDCHIQVSERPDFRFPVSSTFNKLTSQAGWEHPLQWRIPTRGLLNPNTTYYWRVAVMSRYGVYSNWSPTWSFSVRTPGVVLDPRLIQVADSVCIHWRPNTVGEVPIRYFILASDMKGFSYADSLIIDTVSAPHFCVKNNQRMLRHAFYRIIPLGDHGSQGPMSDLISTGNMRLLFPDTPVITLGDSVHVPLVRIEPRDRHARDYHSTIVVIDSLVLNSLELPTGLQLDESGVSGILQSPADSVIHLNGYTSDTHQSFDYSIRLKVNLPPIVEGLTDSAAFEDSLFLRTVRASDPNGDTLRYHLVTRPSWLSIDSINGEMRGVPLSRDVGDTIVAVQVSDHQGGNTEQHFHLHVTHTNHPPVFISMPEPTASEDSLYYARVIASDPDSVLFRDSLSYGLLDSPEWLSLDSVSGVLAGIPQASDVGSATMTLRITDGKGGVVNAPFTLTVRHTNHQPSTAGIPDTLVVEDSLYSQRIIAHDPDSSLFGDVVRYRFTIQPSWLQLDSVSGILTGIASGLNARDTTVGIQAYDNHGLYAEVTFPMHLIHVNHPPVFALLQVPQAQEDSLYRAFVYAVDQDSLYFNDTLRYGILNAPTWLAMDSTSGFLSGVPRAPDVGDSLITIRVRDNHNAAVEQSVNLTVLHTNHSPQFVSNPDTITFEDSSYAYSVRAIDVDTLYFGDVVRYRLAAAPAWLSLDSLSGLLAGAPRGADVGDTVVSVEAYDHRGGLNTQTYRLRVFHTNHAPSIRSSADPIAREDSLYRYKVSAIDIDSAMFGDVLAYHLVVSPGWLAIDTTLGLTTGTPTAFDVGDTAVVVRVHDGHGGIVTQSFTVHVFHTNHPPHILGTPDTVAVEDSLYQYLAYATDRDSALFGDRVRYRLDVRPIWLSVDSMSGLVSGIPQEGDGDTLFTVVATDGLASEVMTAPLRVVPLNDPPVLVPLQPLRFNEDDSAYVAYATWVPSLSDPDDPTETHTWTVLSSIHVFPTCGDSGAVLRLKKNWHGKDTLDVIVTDPGGLSDTSSVVVTIMPVNDPPVIRDLPDIEIPEDSTYTLNLADYIFDPDNTPNEIRWSVQLLDNPNQQMKRGVTIDMMDGSDEEAVRDWQRTSTDNARHSEAGSLTILNEKHLDACASVSALDATTIPLEDSVSIRVDSTSGRLLIQSHNNFWRRGLRFILTARDPLGLRDTDTALASINPVNDPPLLVQPSALEILGSQVLSLSYQYWYDKLTDPDDPDSVHTWRIGNQQNIAVAYTETGVKFKSRNNWSGSETLHLIATDPGGLSDTTGLAIFVLPMKMTEQIVSVPDTVGFVDSLYQYQIRIDGRLPGDTSLVYLLQGPEWLSISSSGLVHGIPHEPGEYRVSIRVLTQSVPMDSQTYAIMVRVVTGVKSNPVDLPTSFALYQNFPNPFNPTSTVAFDLPHAARVTLRLFDLLGREVAILVDETMAAGRHALHIHSSDFASGAYFYHMQAGTFSLVRKMMILR